MIIENLNPGDIVIQKFHDEEVGRYLVLKRIIKRPKAFHVYCQYQCWILRFDELQFGFNFKPGDTWYIDNIDMKAPGEEWEIVVESGLSWIE